MTTQKNPKQRPQVVTPIGTMIYPHFDKPDDAELKDQLGNTVKASGKFVTKFSFDEVEGAQLTDYAKKVLEAAIAQTKSKFPQAVIEQVWPFKEDDKDSTQIVVKADSKFKPKVVDSSRAEFDPSVQLVHTGSKGRLAVTIEDYVNQVPNVKPLTLRVGVKLYLVKAQVTEFAAKPSNAGAGFTDVAGPKPVDPADVKPQGMSYDFD